MPPERAPGAEGAADASAAPEHALQLVDAPGVLSARRVLGARELVCATREQRSGSELGSWGKTMRGAGRNKERWRRRRTPTQDPSTDLVCEVLDLVAVAEQLGVECRQIALRPSPTQAGEDMPWQHDSLRADALVYTRILF